MKEKIKQFLKQLRDSSLDLVLKLINFPVYILTKIVDFIFIIITKAIDMVTNIINAIAAQLSTFKGVMIFIAAVLFLMDVYKKDDAGVVTFVFNKCIELITALATALQISGGVLIGGILAILAFLVYMKKIK